MTLQTKSFAGYALVSPSLGKLITKSFAGYALVAAAPALPNTGKNAHDTLLDQIKAAATESLDNTQITLGAPSVASNPPGGTNTALSATADGEEIEGTTGFFYKRRPLSALWTATLPARISFSGKTRTVELIPELAALSGISLVPSDIVDEPIVVTGEVVTLRAADTSYFFVPGTTLSILSKPLPMLIDYRMEEKFSDTVVRNWADQSLPGTRVGTAPVPAPAKKGMGWGFALLTSIDTGMKVPMGAVSFAGNFSFNNFSSAQVLLGDADVSNTVASRRLAFGVGTTNFEITTCDGVAATTVSSVPHGLSAGVTYSLGFKLNAAGDLATFYRDGQKVGTCPVSRGRGQTLSTANMSLGKLGASNLNGFGGVLDGLKVWNLELTDADFLKVYNDSIDPNPGVWDPAKKGGSVTLSVNNRSAICQASQGARGVKGNNTGRKQFEVTDWTASNNFQLVGVVTATAGTGYPGLDAQGWSYYLNNGNKFTANNSAAFAAAAVKGDVIGIVIDFDLGTMSVYKNGVLLGIPFTGMQGKTLYPACGSGSTSAIQTIGYLNYGSDGFAYPVDGAEPLVIR